MKAGSLRHRITIQRLVESNNGEDGRVVSVPEVFAIVWADIRPSSVKEFISAGISGSKVTTAVKIRFLSGVKPSMRIIHGSHTYNIEGVLADPKSGAEYLTLPCSEVEEG